MGLGIAGLSGMLIDHTVMLVVVGDQSVRVHLYILKTRISILLSVSLDTVMD